MYKTIATAPLLADPPELLRSYMIANARKQLSIPGRKEVDTFDLFPFYSILVSTVINKNRDAFDPVEVWRARHSPEDKPLNYMHDGKRVIGHITDCIAVDEDLKPIPEDTSEGDLPYKLHIVTSNVIYRVSDDKYHQEFLDSIISKITKGSLAVSMECLFRDFAFLLWNSKGEHKLIERNDRTNHLTKFLRQYKGSGKVNEYEIGRLLRDITFSAVGLVDNPANPESIISDKLNLFNDSKSSAVYINLDQPSGDIQMAESVKADDMSTEEAMADVTNHPQFKNLQDKHDRLQKDHDTLKTHSEDMKQKLDHIHEHTMAKETEDKEKLEKEVAALKLTIAELDAKAKSDKDEKDKMEKDCCEANTAKASVQKENDAYKATIDAYKKAERGAARVSLLMDADKSLDKAAAEEIVTKAEEVGDGAFEIMVKTIAGYATKAPKEVTAKEVVATAKAEVGADVTLGVTPEKTHEVVKAQISEYMKNQLNRGTKGAK